jgi:hypothetical protein
MMLKHQPTYLVRLVKRIILTSNQDQETLNGFPNESIAKITDIARAKIERMLLQKYGKSIVEFRVYRRRKFPYLVVAKLKDGIYKMQVLQ